MELRFKERCDLLLDFHGFRHCSGVSKKVSGVSHVPQSSILVVVWVYGWFCCIAFRSVLLFLFPLLAERVLLRSWPSHALYFLSALFLVYILE